MRAAETTALIEGKVILVVDDEAEVAGLLADMLSADGHQVETAENGAVALDKLRGRAYDLVLSDLRMPELDGPGLYQELQRRDPRLCRRVIFLTGDVGVLNIGYKRTRQLSDREISRGAAFASQAAAAIENARLYEEADRGRHEAEMLTRASRMLTESLDTSAIAERTAEFVHELLSTKTSALRLLEPDGSLRAFAFGGSIRSHRLVMTLTRGAGFGSGRRERDRRPPSLTITW